MRRLPFVLLLAALPVPVAHADAAPPAARYLDLLDLRGTPTSATDRRFNLFFDAGAWHGYSLPARDEGTGFSGPFVHSLDGGRWAGRRFAAWTLEAAPGQPLALAATASHAGPGYLERTHAGAGIAVRETLFFADAWHAVARIELVSAQTRDVRLRVTGESMGGAARAENGVVVQALGRHSTLATRLFAGSAATARAEGPHYRLEPTGTLHLDAGKPLTLFVEQTLVHDATKERPPAIDYALAWQRNRARWDGYLAAADAARLPGVPDDVARRVAAKAMVTLLANWRAARGDLRHDGVIPAYSNPDFNGFWAWDSWKHAAALARFAPDLARDQIRAMFDWQRADGMVPDCIYLDAKDNNWRDTKPPLATWAVLAVYDATGDRAFLAEMYDKLARYHRWWWTARDHDRDGLAEFGSTDGTRIAAAWESGMDNAVRFDGAKMLANGPGAWSLDQASVDLNAYLYKEALDLTRIAEVLGKADERAAWTKEAERIRTAVRSRMFDRERGYFFDIRLKDGAPVRVYGPEGWTPLWAGLADADEARAVSRVMLDPSKFATRMPFPILAADDARFSPIKGYWRGPVWLDQAYFGVEALRHYGYAAQADEMARRLVLQASGLVEQAPFYENYDPLTGNGYQSRNFSWSAAAYLMMLTPEPTRR
jgi:putative isomerase